MHSFSQSFGRYLLYCNKRSFCNFVETTTYRSFQEIPGPKAYPVIGTVYKYLPFIGDYNTETLDKNAWYNWRRYGPLVREELFNGVGLLNLYDPQDMEAVLRQDDKLPCRSSHVAMYHYRMNKPDVYNTGGLLSTNGPEWWRLRSTYQRNFTGPQSVKPFVKRTEEVTKNFVTWIGERNVSEKEDFLYYLNRLFLEVIGVVAFDENFNSFKPDEQLPDSRSSKIIDAAFNSNSGVLKLDTGFVWRIIKTPLYRKLANSQGYLEKVATDILVNRMEYFESRTKEKPHCLLDDFLNQPNVDMKDTVAMMVDILMAAIDTSSLSTSFLLYHIAKNPERQQKLYQEVQKLLPTKDCEITSEVLSKANYARCCIKESLRLNPVAIGFSRVVQRDIVLRDFLVPKGTVIVFQNMVTSRLPANVKNPDHYYPERWLRGTETCEGVHPFVSLPFGYGLRSCIARRLAEQNICIALLSIIRNYEMKWNGPDLGIVTHLINKPDRPVNLTFVKRSTCT